MRVALATVIIIAFAAPVTLPSAAAHGRGPWCVIENNGETTWFCYPTRALYHRFGEAPGTGLYYVQNLACSRGG